MRKPFAHEDLEIKQNFLKVAREFHAKSDTLENELAAALLYMNMADYLAEYLIVGLTDMTKEALSKYYLGMVSMRAPQRDSFNIGNSIYHLERYDFPRKDDILSELRKINEARKQLAHQILKTSARDLSKIDEAAAALADHTETLVELIDEISLGMPPQNIVDKYLLSDQESQSIPEPVKQQASTDKAKVSKKTRKPNDK